MSISYVFTRHKGYNNVLGIWRCLRSEFTAKPSLKEMLIARWNQTIAKLYDTTHQNLNLQKFWQNPSLQYVSHITTMIQKALAANVGTPVNWTLCIQVKSNKQI
jgi:hypothetical protein